MEPDRPHDPALISEVTPGMRVVDAKGDDVGTVDMVTLGDPNAVRVQPPGGGAGAGGSIADLVSAAAFTEPDVPADAAAHLQRTGFLKVNRGAGCAVYVEAGQISDLDDVVRLSVPIADLMPAE
ncbi:MAG TPA: hypothetical protein VF462_11215 [Micromonosporaceae bacterium]